MIIIAALIAAATAYGCGRPFNVKPRPDKVSSQYRASGESDGVALRAEPLTDEDYLYEIFDANLIAAGIYPVRVMVTNTASGALDLKKMRFEVRSEAGLRFKAAEARRAYKRLFSYYEITAYSKDGYKSSLSDFISHALDIDSPLGPGESRQGILFFPVSIDLSRPGQLTLIASPPDKKLDKSAGGEIELKLN